MDSSEPPSKCTGFALDLYQHGYMFAGRCIALAVLRLSEEQSHSGEWWSGFCELVDWGVMVDAGDKRGLSWGSHDSRVAGERKAMHRSFRF